MGSKPLRALSTSPTVIMLPWAPWPSLAFVSEGGVVGLCPACELWPVAVPTPRRDPLAVARLPQTWRRSTVS